MLILLNDVIFGVCDVNLVDGLVWRRSVDEQREEKAETRDAFDDDARPEDAFRHEQRVVDPARAALVAAVLPDETGRVEDDAEHDRRPSLLPSRCVQPAAWRSPR